MSTKEAIIKYYAKQYHPEFSPENLYLDNGFEIATEYSEYLLAKNYKCQYALNEESPTVPYIQLGPISNRAIERSKVEILTPTCPPDLIGFRSHAFSVAIKEKEELKASISDMEVPIVEINTITKDGSDLLSMSWQKHELWRIKQFGHRMPHSRGKGRIIPNFNTPSIQFNRDRVAIEAQYNFDEEGFPFAQWNLEYNGFAPLFGNAEGYKLAIKGTDLTALLLITALPPDATAALGKSV